MNSPEIGANASALLKCLGKHFVLPDVIVCHRATSEPHGFLKVVAADLWDGIVVIILREEYREELIEGSNKKDENL